MTCPTVKEKCSKSVKMRVSLLVLGLLSVALIHIAEPRKLLVVWKIGFPIAMLKHLLFSLVIYKVPPMLHSSEKVP